MPMRMTQHAIIETLKQLYIEALREAQRNDADMHAAGVQDGTYEALMAAGFTPDEMDALLDELEIDA